MLVFRPYISRELPGWGQVYKIFIGDWEADPKWKGYSRQWMRGKMHPYEMSLDMGYWSNRATYFLKRYPDLPTQLAIRTILRAGDTFVDIGGNEGMISLLASFVVGPAGKVIAFEPNPNVIPRFKANLERNRIANVRLEEVGLGSVDATLELTVPYINSGEGSFGQPKYDVGEVYKVNCAIRRGDDLLAGEIPRLMKIDVEGFEYQVLQGLGITLQKHKPSVIMEMYSSHLKGAGSSIAEIVGLMSDAGYVPFELSVRSRRYLKLKIWKPDDDANADIFWMHPKNPTIDPALYA